MKKIIAFFLIISLFSLSSDALGMFKDKAVDVISDVSKNSYTYLILGLDDASSNTDVIILFNYDGEKNSYSVLGIPRDTFFSPSPRPHKINGYLASSNEEDNIPLSRLTDFKDILSSSLGIRIDGAVSYTMDAIAGIVDALGGINVDVPINMSGTGIDGKPIEINQGRQNLSGREAVFFLRYREGYALGDLGRMDAQKLFISSFIDKIKSGFNPEIAIKLLTYRSEGVITDINTVELLSFALKNIFKIKSVNGSFATLPGQALLSDFGVSYYSLSKKASEEALVLLNFRILGNFDKECFFKAEWESFREVYDADTWKYKIYSDTEIGELAPIFK